MGSREDIVKTAHCATCGAEMEIKWNASSKGHYFCSYKCHMIHKYKLPPTGVKTCEHCGREYFYEQGQGNWTKNNEKLWSSGGVNGKGKVYTVQSHRFCCYECGIKHKETLRKKSSIEKYGRCSPFQDREFMEKVYEENIRNGKQFVSQGELAIKAFVESLGLKTEKLLCGAGNSKTSPRFEIDIYIPEKKIGIEYNGSYYHSINGRKEGRMTKSYHFNKAKIAKEKGIELIQIWEDLWNNQQDIIKDVLRARLNAIEKKDRIYARQCTIKEIDVPTYKKFCEENHIQGYRSASIRFGLFYNDNLVQIASFAKTRNMGKASTLNKEFDYEWVRGCVASNNKVTGGTTKLFKHFIKTYNPNSVLCYADWNLFNGNGYKECGFEFDGYTGPDKFYVTVHSTKRINRSPSKYHEYKKLVEEGKLFECYGAGSMRFIWKKI